MLKRYNVKTEYNIDRLGWKPIFHEQTHLIEEKPEEEIIVGNFSFDDMYKYLLSNFIWGIRPYRTFFTNKKMISIKTDDWFSNPIEYKRFDSISVRKKYEELKVTPKDLIDEDIELVYKYLKERNMPILIKMYEQKE